MEVAVGQRLACLAVKGSSGRDLNTAGVDSNLIVSRTIVARHCDQRKSDNFLVERWY